MYSAHVKTKTKMIAVVFDDYSKSTSTWIGNFGMILGGELYIDISDDNNYDNKIKLLSNEIYKRSSS